MKRKKSKGIYRKSENYRITRRKEEETRKTKRAHEK